MGRDVLFTPNLVPSEVHVKYVVIVVFSVFGAYLVIIGILIGGAGWLLLWPGGSLLVVAAAYAGVGPSVFGKRSDGTMAWWAVALLLPYLGLTWVVWHLHRLLSKEDCCNEIAPGIWVGRRAFANELPANVGLVVDLTAEFFEPAGVVSRGSYLCLPTLDASVPRAKSFEELVQKIAAWEGSVYIHCAFGHSRSATVAAAVLITRGLARDAAQAQSLLKKARPRTGLNRVQRKLLTRVKRVGAA
jgi:protein-tyrosine phosphatase